MCDFELGLRKSIKKVFEGGLLQGCYFHFCKSIWTKIKKLHLFKKEMRNNTLIIAFLMKIYPFVIEKNKVEFLKKIEQFCTNLKGNYITLRNYFSDIGKIHKYLILMV